MIKNKLRLPHEFVLNSQNFKFVRSSLTRGIRFSYDDSLVKRYFRYFLKIFHVYEIIKKIKFLILSRNPKALFVNNIELWYATYMLLKNHPDIIKVQLKMRRGSNLSGSYQFERLNEIDQLFHKFNPLSILEYGSGTSSAMFAKLAGDKIYFQTTDELKWWLEKIFVSLPNSLKLKVNAILAKTKVDEVDSELVISYDTAHDKYFDFIYVDGPYNAGPEILSSERLTKVKDPLGQHLPNYDVELFWENGIYPKFILIDGRRSTVRRLILKGIKYYRIYLKSAYNLPLKKEKEANYYLYHTILIRKDVLV